MTTLRVYFSRSYATDDENVCQTIRAFFETGEIQRHFDLELFDSQMPTGAPVAEKIAGDLNHADVVVCIFTKRHELANGKFMPPAYIGTEASYANAKGKQLILFLEEGIDDDHLGFIKSLGFDYATFRRSELQHVGFRDRAVKLISARLGNQALVAAPAHRIKKYELHYTVFPDGYVMSHRKLAVEIVRPEPIPHSFQGLTSPGGKKRPLATSAKLLAEGRQTAVPYPKKAFVAFSCEDPNVGFVADRPTSVPSVRRFRATFATAGTYHYEWVWGLPGGFDPKKDLEALTVKVSSHSVYRVDIYLRLHRQIVGRKRPMWAPVAPDESERDEPIKSLAAVYARGLGPNRPVPRTSPLYVCHEFSITPLERGTDLMVLY